MTERSPATAREWLAGWPFPWPPLHSLAEGAVLRACYCVIEAQLARTRNDQAYLRLSLTDRHGAVEGRVWERAAELSPLVRAGAYVGVQGRVERFNGELQLCVEALVPLHVELHELELFLPRSDRDSAAMNAELAGWMDSVQDEGLRTLLHALIGPGTEIGEGFRLAPAAKYNHHAFLGGLLEHTLSVTRLCDLLAAHYGAELDRDLLVTAALLHDVGKVREIGARAGFPYTDEGKLLGHILLGLQMVAECAAGVPSLPPARLLLLQHLIASHQGRYEWQSPREPSVLEGLVLHYADDLDAKLQQVRELMGRSQGAWTAYDRSFRREFLRHTAIPLPTHPGERDQPVAAEPSASPGKRHRERPADASAEPPPRIYPEHHGPPTEPGPPRLSDDTLDLFGGS